MLFSLGIAAADVAAFSRAGLGLSLQSPDPLIKAGAVTVMLLSAAGVGYANYRCVYGAPGTRELRDKMPAPYYVDQLKRLQKELPFAAAEIRRGTEQWADYLRKQDALARVLALNGNKGLDVLTSTDQETAATLAERFRQMVTRLTILDRQDAGRYGETARPEMLALLRQNEEMLSQFDVLLDEVSRMGDQVDVSNVGLLSAIDALQKLRGAQSADPGFEAIARAFKANGYPKEGGV